MKKFVYLTNKLFYNKNIFKRSFSSTNDKCNDIEDDDAFTRKQQKKYNLTEYEKLLDEKDAIKKQEEEEEDKIVEYNDILDDTEDIKEKAQKQQYMDRDTKKPKEIKISEKRQKQQYGEDYLKDIYIKDIREERYKLQNGKTMTADTNFIKQLVNNTNDTPEAFQIPSERYKDIKNILQLAPKDDIYNDILDPLNPPRLEYKHQKMIKNIDYSPLLVQIQDPEKRFTAEKILNMMFQTPETFHTYLAKTASSRIPYRYQPKNQIERTVDQLNASSKQCPQCKFDPTPEKQNRIHFTNVELLLRYINQRGQIYSRKTTGVCKKHQTKLRYAIKNARALGLLSSLSNWSIPKSYLFPHRYDVSYDQLYAQSSLIQAALEKHRDARDAVHIDQD